MRRHSPYNFGFDNPIYFQDYDGMMPQGPGNPIKKAAKKAAKRLKKAGRQGRQAKLRSLLNEGNVSKADKGWIKSQINQIRRGKRKTIKTPPGKELAHERGREAAKGYGYKHSNLQDKDLHRLQHKFDNNGKKNKERPDAEEISAFMTSIGLSTNVDSDNTDTNDETSSHDETKSITGSETMDNMMSFWVNNVMDNVENAGTKIFGDNDFGDTVDEFNPLNLGLAELLQSLLEEDNKDNENKK